MSTQQQTDRAVAGGGGESTSTVLVALGADLLVAVAEGVAAVVTGSASMAAETAHSFAETVDQVFLLTALEASTKPADRTHPFGCGRVRYFWALLAAVSIFVTGALCSAYEGVTALLSEDHEVVSPVVNHVVLGVAFLLGGFSLLKGYRQTRAEAAQHDQPLRTILRTSDDPTATSVVFEDSAALAGLVLAAAGTAVHQVTGESWGDGIASTAIAVLLAGVALRLGRANTRLLTDVQADPRLVRAVVVRMGDAPEVEAVVVLLTLTLGTDQVLVCARLDLQDDLGAADVELAVVRIAADLEATFLEVVEVFLEPVPREDAVIREHVRSCCGERIARSVVEEAGRWGSGPPSDLAT